VNPRGCYNGEVALRAHSMGSALLTFVVPISMLYCPAVMSASLHNELNCKSIMQLMCIILMWREKMH